MSAYEDSEPQMDARHTNPKAYDQLCARLKSKSRTWLVTGVAGFIGSNLLETLLLLGQRVVGLDNFATGHRRNLDEVRAAVSEERWTNFHFIEGDIRNLEHCRGAMTWHGGRPSDTHAPVEQVLHQAALGSVPRSLADPLTTNGTNVDGFLNMVVAARDAKVKSFVYAASSSTYGDHPALPKVEDVIGSPLSPYAVTKYVNELYAAVFARCYGLNTIGLRYFNVFGARQDPNGAYAAVIPKWISSLLRSETVFVNGDGETSRDFCYVQNAVQANLLAATSTNQDALNQVYNVAAGERTSLNELLTMLHDELATRGFLTSSATQHREARAGDVRHSLAEISKITQLLGYTPTHCVRAGIRQSLNWYIELDTLQRRGGNREQGARP